MLKWVVFCWAVLVLVGADVCPDGGRCEDGQTCCDDPDSGYECCPFEQAECCGDHVHCCPAGTTCSEATSSCVNATASVPWVERSTTDQPRVSKSFRMIKSNAGEDDDNICPDKSRCPAEFSCLKALTRFGCCPLAQGVSCSDGKHCCPEGHECSSDCRSCIKKEVVTTVLCSDGVSECPDGTTCCESPEGKWGCCPMPQAVCCSDKVHCCPEGSVCDLEHSKCISSSTRKEMPMWAKLPARIRAEWEDQKEDEKVTSETVDEQEVPPSDEEVADDVPCDDATACPDNTTCCKTKEGDWSCCPLPEAVCCPDLLHCCPHGKKCNMATMTCDDETCSVPWLSKIPARPRQSVRAEDVQCDSTASCPDNTTCCKNKEGEWGCCPLPQAVCCDDHEHCCPAGTTCDVTTTTCVGSSGSTPMLKKIPALGKSGEESSEESDEDSDEKSDEDSDEKSDEESDEKSDEDSDEKSDEDSDEKSDEDSDEKSDESKEDDEEEDDGVQCDPHTSCPRSTTCCFMKSTQRWGCCPLPEAVCCSDGDHCCPADYKCDESQTSCVRGDVVIPWYTKLPASSSSSNDKQPDVVAVQCDDRTQCPDATTCCQLATGEWGCCPLQNAVCCPDKEHCCPQGYTCNIASNSCQKHVTVRLDTLPLTPVYLARRPRVRDVKCDDTTSCEDGETCCRTSATTWGCCPFANAVCCSDLLHCCPAGYTCTPEGDCNKTPSLSWLNWNKFVANNKRAVIA